MLVFSLKKNRVLNSNLVREEINLNNGIQCKLSEENNLQIDNSSEEQDKRFSRFICLYGIIPTLFLAKLLKS